tara:strand:- start:139 stop:930 length:792 start_codon:yes stop_codon:yes gene_type:complete
MKKVCFYISSLILLLFLANCAPSAYRTSYGGLAVAVDPWGDTSYYSIKSEADRACRYLGNGTAVNLVEKIKSDGISNAHWTFDCSSGSNSYSSSSSYSSSQSNNYYSNSTPKLFYDSSTGGMKECTYVPQDGNCLSFKPYKASNYNKSTLFYDSSSNSMKPCIGIVDLNGKCTAFGIYNASTTTKDQLFYNPQTRKMTTCNFVTITGECSHYDIVPRTGSTGGSYNIDSASNPYYKKVPRTSQQLMKSGMDMLSGNCTLGLNC